MFQNIKKLYGSQIAASDGVIGHIKDFYFDDQRWAARYLVVDTGLWLSGRLVLISPHSFGHFDQDQKILNVSLTKAQIENCPPMDSHRPVSRQYEEAYYSYYGWPTYWTGDLMWGVAGFPILNSPPLAGTAYPRHPNPKRADLHLRSTQAVTSYEIQAVDGTIGSVSGFMVDDKSWAIGEIVAETGHWYSGKEILIPTSKITRISYEESKIHVNLTLADLKATGENEVAATGGSNPAANYSQI